MLVLDIEQTRGRHGGGFASPNLAARRAEPALARETYSVRAPAGIAYELGEAVRFRAALKNLLDIRYHGSGNRCGKPADDTILNRSPMILQDRPKHR